MGNVLHAKQAVIQGPDGVGPPPGLDLSTAEVKYFWSFHDGSIMCIDVRHHLWRSWGFCPRHTWALAVTEPEYRLTLHGTSILYEDLIGRAARVLRRRSLASSAVAKRLAPHDSCFCCDFVAIGDRFAPDAKLRALATRVNERKRFTALLAGAERAWRPRTCPCCAGGDGPVCRQHILSGADVPGDSSDRLEDIRRRLSALEASMRWQGPPADEQANASWVEALGWFAGWGYLKGCP